VHIFNFEQEIYGEKLKVEVIKQIRPEMKFKDLEELTGQLVLDSEEARAILTEDLNQKNS
jgi:riboflavin kinase/FMN adenylyltransferase